MPIPITPGAPCLARRELRRQEINDFGDQITWLSDPGSIPEFATTLYHDPMPGVEFSRHYSLGTWMLSKIMSWSAEVHAGLDYGKVFEKHQLSNQERAVVRDSIRQHTETSYGTGIMAMTMVHRAVPEVAVRDGIDDPAAWEHIASQAKRFGNTLAHDGSNVLALAREYLVGGYCKDVDFYHMNAGKLKLDEETGITTVTPIDRLVTTLTRISKKFYQENHSGTCVALQASANPSGCEPKIFDAMWNAYGVAAAKYIYPNERPEAAAIPAQETPDVNLTQNIYNLIAEITRQREVGERP